MATKKSKQKGAPTPTTAEDAEDATLRELLGVLFDAVQYLPEEEQETALPPLTQPGRKGWRGKHVLKMIDQLPIVECKSAEPHKGLKTVPLLQKKPEGTAGVLILPKGSKKKPLLGSTRSRRRIALSRKAKRKNHSV